MQTYPLAIAIVRRAANLQGVEFIDIVCNRMELYAPLASRAFQAKTNITNNANIKIYL